MKLKLVSDYKKRLDKLCREVVMLRDRSCQWCGKTSNLQWCHIQSRRYLSTRWSLNNTLMLCSGCHLKWHHRPLEAVEWFNNRFPERYLILRAAGTGKVDPHATWIWLTQQKKRMEALTWVDREIHRQYGRPIPSTALITEKRNDRDPDAR